MRSAASGDATTAGSAAGGLIGQQYAGSLTQSYATGNATAVEGTAGGLVGSLEGDGVEKAYTAGVVERIDASKRILLVALPRFENGDSSA